MYGQNHWGQMVSVAELPLVPCGRTSSLVSLPWHALSAHSFAMHAHTIPVKFTASGPVLREPAPLAHLIILSCFVLCQRPRIFMTVSPCNCLQAVCIAQFHCCVLPKCTALIMCDIKCDVCSRLMILTCKVLTEWYGGTSQLTKQKLLGRCS